MAEYRDDEGALRQRAQLLEEDLAERDRLLAEQRAELERQRAELASQQAELAQFRAAAAVPQPPAATSAGTRVCAACGKENRAHYTFCLGCGADLNAAGTPAATASAPLQAQRKIVLFVAVGAVVALLLVVLVVMVARG